MKYVIIGGDAAGMSAAMQVMKYDNEAEIVILEKGDIYSYGQCGLPYAISGLVEDTADLIARSVDTYREKYNMDARINHEVKQIDPGEKTVSGHHILSGEPFCLSYDKLLIASGADPVHLNWSGMDLHGVYSLKTIPDVKAILANLDKDIENITVVGGGYIGLEVAENFKLLEKNVRLIHRGSYVGKIFDEDMAQFIHDEAKKHDIDLIVNESVEELIGDKGVHEVKTNKATYETDLALISVGIQPNTSFLKNTQIVTGLKGAIQTNEWMETNIKDIYAAGDCALQYNMVKGQDDYVPLGTTANKQGRIAGMNMAGKDRAFKGITGTSIMKFMDLSLGKTGLSEKEADDLNITYDTVYIKGRDIASYYPNAKPIHVKLIYQKNNHHLLGAQVIGEKGVDKRIDVLSTALYNQMKIEDLEDLDLSYAPPFNGVWDPIQKAARRAR